MKSTYRETNEISDPSWNDILDRDSKIKELTLIIAELSAANEKLTSANVKLCDLLKNNFLKSNDNIY